MQHERRARIIAQLHEQAIAQANSLGSQKFIKVGVAKAARRRNATGWLIAAVAFAAAMAWILASLAQ